MNVTIPTSNYCQSIWNNWFVISFTGLAVNIAKPFKPISLLRGGGGGRDERGWVLCVNLNVTIPTSDYSESIWDDRFVISFIGLAVKIVQTLILIE